MNTKKLLLMLTASMVVSVPVYADNPTIRGWQHPPNDELDVGLTQIRVNADQSTRRYTRVKNRRVNAWIVVDGHAPKRANRPLGAKITIEDKTVNIPSPTERSTYRVRFDYKRPRSEHVANQRLRPVAMCNERLESKSGQARIDFLRNGESFWLNNAYRVELSSTWLVNAKDRGVFEAPPSSQTWRNETTISARVVCEPVDPNAGATRTTPKEPPRRTSPAPANLPRVKKATLNIAPFDIKTHGNFRCPAKLRLRGFLETNKRMRGDVIFVGPTWLSAKKSFNFDGADTLNHIAVYDLSWAGGINQLSSNQVSPPRQDLTFKFNVINARGKLVESVSRDIRVTCERP